MQNEDIRRTIRRANRASAESLELARRARHAAAESLDACAATHREVLESLHAANDASRSLMAFGGTLGADPRDRFYVVNTERRLHERAFPAPNRKDQPPEAANFSGVAADERRALIVHAEHESVIRLSSAMSDAGWRTVGGDTAAALYAVPTFRPDAAAGVLLAAPANEANGVLDRTPRDAVVTNPIILRVSFNALQEALAARTLRVRLLHARPAVDQVGDNRRR